MPCTTSTTALGAHDSVHHRACSVVPSRDVTVSGVSVTGLDHIEVPSVGYESRTKFVRGLHGLNC